MNRVRVGVVGIGHLGISHARTYRKLTKAKLVAISDIDTIRLKQAQEELALPAYTDYKRLFGQVCQPLCGDR